MSNEEQIERCKREAELCRIAGADPDLTVSQKLGAVQGEMDWLVALQITEEWLDVIEPTSLQSEVPSDRP